MLPIQTKKSPYQGRVRGRDRRKSELNNQTWIVDLKNPNGTGSEEREKPLGLKKKWGIEIRERFPLSRINIASNKGKGGKPQGLV